MAIDIIKPIENIKNIEKPKISRLYDREEYKKYRLLSSEEKADAPVPETEDVDFEKSTFGGVYSRDGVIYKSTDRKGEKVLANFIFVILYQISDGTKDTRQLVKIFNSDNGEENFIELSAKELNSLQDFKIAVGKVAGNFFGNAEDLTYIIRRLYTMQGVAELVKQVGYYPEKNIFVLYNAIYDLTQRKVYTPDKAGVVNIEGKLYYLPFNTNRLISNTEAENYEDYKYIFYDDASTMTVNDLLALMWQASGIETLVVSLLMCGSVFFDINAEKMGNMPYIFLYGERNTGKSAIMSQLLSLFGKGANIGLGNAGTTTQKAVARTLSRDNNLPKYLNEWRNSESTEGVLKNAYDLKTGSRANKTNDTTTTTERLKGMLFIDGNTKPVNDDAVVSRGVFTEFRTRELTESNRNAIEKLEREKENTYTKALFELLAERERYKQLFADKYDNAVKELIQKAPDNRTTKSHALILSIYDCLSEIGFKMPVYRKTIKDQIFEMIERQEKELAELDITAIFWNSVAWAIQNGNNLYKSFTYLRTTNAFAICLKDFSTSYAIYCRNNNIAAYDFKTVRNRLEVKSYEPFIATNKTTRIDDYTIKMTHFKAVNENGVISVGGIEILKLEDKEY